jgi:hypothetical protein
LGWVKRGQVFEVGEPAGWMASRHAQLPVPVLLDDGRLRVYFSSRDGRNRSRSGFFETEADEPANVAYVHDRPALDLGRPGAFDDSGVMASCVVEAEGLQHLYYVGFTTGVDDVPYETNVGLAVSCDGGLTFTRPSEAPVFDRIDGQAHGTNSPFVLREAGVWKMWFGSFNGWDTSTGRAEPMYVIRYASSSDGLHWERDDADCVEPLSDSEANARAWVLREGDAYRMWFSYRSILDFRENPNHSYRIGYAESDDGVRWERRDDEAGIGPSEKGWDSEMAAYGCVYEHGGSRHLLYNGNGFGRSGIGHAVAA